MLNKQTCQPNSKARLSPGCSPLGRYGAKRMSHLKGLCVQAGTNWATVGLTSYIFYKDDTFMENFKNLRHRNSFLLIKYLLHSSVRGYTRVYDHVCVFRCDCDVLVYCLSMNKAKFDLLKGHPGCLLSLMAQGAEGCQQALFPISVIFHVNLIYLLKHDEEKLLLWLPFGQHTRKKRVYACTCTRAHTCTRTHSSWKF